MTANRFHNHLRLLGPGLRLLNPEANVIALPSRPEIATREALLERLETIGELAPQAPLSFLVVNVIGACAHENADQLRLIARRVRELTRGTDLVGRLDEHSFGVALQGTGLVAAGAVAARLTHHLNRIAELSPAIFITVSAATGTGINARTLPIAAMESTEPCCG